MRGVKVLLVLALLATATYAAKDNKDKNNKNSNNNNNNKDGGNNNNNNDNKDNKGNNDKSPSPQPNPSPSPSPSPSPPAQVALCRRHTVKPGDNAQSLSAEYGVRYEDMVAALAQCIGFVEGSFLNVGQSVCLPPYSPACVHVASVADGKDQCKVYTVQPGDTMDSLASSFGFSTAELIALNSDVPVATPGQRLKLPPWGDSCPKDLSAGDEPCRVFRARAGDTLAAIATGFRTTVDKLVDVNTGFSASTVLSVGQPVRIPPYGENCGAGRVVAGFPTDGVTVCRSYRVAPGDSVYSIALAFGAASGDLVTLNPELANPSQLALGDAIKIPPWDDSCSEEGVTVPKPGSGGSNPPSGGVPVVSAPPSSRLPVTGSPVPAANPTPAPVVVNPSTPTPVTPASNATSNTTAQKSKIEMFVVGVTKEEFAIKQQAVVTSLATAAGVPSSNVTITYVLAATPPSRRLLQDGAVKVQAVVTGNSDAIQSNLEGADRAGTLTASFEMLGMTLNTMTFINPAGESTVIVEAPAPAPAADSGDDWPLPIPLGAVVGASVGLVVAIVAVVWLCCCLSKRRRHRAEEAAAAASGPGYGLQRYPSGVNAYVTTTSGNFSGKKVARSPPRSPQRGTGPRSASRTRAINNEAFVLSTTVSTPRYDDFSSADVPSSQPPSSSASLADTLEGTPVVITIAEPQQPEQPQLSPRESVVSSPGAPSFQRPSVERPVVHTRRPSGGASYVSPYSQRGIGGSGSGSARAGTYVSPYSQRRLRSNSSTGSPTAAGGSARRTPANPQRSRLASYAEV